MSRDLTNLFIDETFQFLTQISGSNQDILLDGVGNQITELDITASNSISSSHSVTALSSSFANISISSSYATAADTSISSSHALNADNAITAQTAISAIGATNTDVQVKNLSGVELPKGTPLYFTDSGTSGNIVGVYPADAANPLRMPAAGIAGETLAIGAEGQAFLDGYIGGVDTSLFGPGDSIWVAAGGGFTNQRPTGSNILVQGIGYVAKSHPNGSGVIQGSGRANDVPNIQEGNIWVGDADGVAIQIPTSSLVGDSFPYTGSAIISGSLVVETLNNPGVKIVNPSNSNNFIQMTPEDGNSYTKNAFNMVAEKSFFQSPGDLFFNTNWDAGSSGSINFITNPNGAFGFENGPVFFKNGASNTRFKINQSPGFTGSLLTANNVDEFKITGDTALAIDNTGYAGTNDVSLKASRDVSIDAVGDINVQGKAFAYSISSNINGFSIQVNEDTFVRDNQRAFVETPLTIGTNGSVEVGTNSTLKVINEL